MVRITERNRKFGTVQPALEGELHRVARFQIHGRTQSLEPAILQVDMNVRGSVARDNDPN